MNQMNMMGGGMGNPSMNQNAMMGSYNNPQMNQGYGGQMNQMGGMGQMQQNPMPN